MLNEAMENYDFKHPEAILLRHNENMTYLVKDNNQRFLLRIHETVDGLDLSAGCRNIPRHILIDSEIELLNLLRTVGNLKTQYPIKNKYNEYITYLEERVPVTLLSWLEGEDLQKTIITDELAYLIGQTIGNIHNAMSTISYTASHHNKRFQNEKFVQALDRWCDTILAPFIMIFKQTE